jgi:hypothetical protein
VLLKSVFTNISHLFTIHPLEWVLLCLILHRMCILFIQMCKLRYNTTCLSNRQGQVHSDVFSHVTCSQTQVQRQDERALYDATEEEKEALRPTFTLMVDGVCTFFSFCTNS